MIVTLLTDFGTEDYFVGAMKGAILSINAEERVVDITHDVPPQAIEAGAFLLLAAYETFPAGTIHVAVVDPGVGSVRRPVIVSTKNYLFVGPDNGLFSYISEREKDVRVFHITEEKYFRKPLSNTFHGRDIFAPIAGALSKGIRPEEFGPEIEDYVRLDPLAPEASEDGTLTARIIHIDHFGNCIINVTREHLTDEMIARGARLIIGENEITSFRHFFADEANDSNPLFALWGSAGFLEIVANRASAAKLLNAHRGQSVSLLQH